MINKNIIITSFVLAACFATQAQTFSSTPLLNSPTPAAVQGSDDCIIRNLQGLLISGFLDYAPGVGTHAILIDPTGTDADGDPGCGGDFNGMLFDINDVIFILADETVFAEPGDGIGEVTFEVSIHPFLVPGDASMGPGPATTTETQLFTADGSGLYNVVTPFPAQESISEPFYISWRFISFVSTNGGINRITPLWDGVPRPLGRQFVDNNGLGFVDHTTFFGDGENGWLDVVIDGNFRSVANDTDLSISKISDALGNVDINDTVNYTLTVNNIGALSATNVVVSDSLPASLAYTSSTCSDGSTSVVAGQTVTFNLNDIAAATSTSCVITTTVTGFGQISNTASVSADNDSTSANNSSSTTVNGPIHVIPSLTIYGLLMMALMLIFFARRRAK